MPLIPLERPINKNTEVNNPEIEINYDAAVNRSHDLLPSNGSNSDVQPPVDRSNSNDASHRPTRNSRRRNVTFQGVPKHSPVNVDTLGLRRSPGISALRRKQLDPTLNHVDFVHVDNALEEDMDPLKENYTFKEAMRSTYEDEFASAMVQEINNHTTRKHWKHVRKSEAPASQILRSTWTFRIET